MSLFTNKKVWQKLLIIFLIIILFQAVFMKPAHAVDADILLKPITGLFVGLADALESVMQKIVLGIDESLIEVKDNGAGILATVICIGLFIAGTALAILTAIPSGGASVGAWVAFWIGAASTVAISFAGYAIFGQTLTKITEKKLSKEFDLPQYELSPYEIFADRITVLDVNFFNPKPNEQIGVTEYDAWESISLTSRYGGTDISNDGRGQGSGNALDTVNGDKGCEMSSQSYDTLKNDYGMQTTQNGSAQNIGFGANYTEYDWAHANEDYKMVVMFYNQTNQNGNVTVYLWKKVPRTTAPTGELKSPANELKTYIAGWYKTLRNLALVILLSILVYVGIRIMLSSVASDKAKYKQMLGDWVVAVCLLFLMHYIMSFSIYIVNELTDMIVSIQADGSKKNEVLNQIRGNLTVDQEKNLGAAVDILLLDGTGGNNDMADRVKNAYDTLAKSGSDRTRYADFFFQDAQLSLRANDKNNAKVLIWPVSNFMEEARVKYQLHRIDGTDNISMYGYGLIYVILVIYTIIFLFTYMKRVVYMAFLTVIAPLVAVTYPIDKMNDGKAQAFNMWFKEYIFNLLIQPLHLIMYSVLIGSAMSFATENLVYVVMALGFFVPAEKLLRRFFGFEKAQTPGMFAGAAGAALLHSGLSHLMRPRPPIGGPGGKGEKGGKGEIGSGDDEDGKPPRTAKIDETSGFLGDNNESNNGNITDEPDQFKFNVNDENDPNAQKYHEAATGQREARLGMQDATTEAERQEYNDLYNSYGKDIDGLRNPEYIKWRDGQNPWNANLSRGTQPVRNIGGADKAKNPNNTSEKDKKGTGGGKWAGIKAGVRGYRRGMHKRYLARKQQNGGMLKKGIRMAGGIATATAATAAAGVIGITSGDIGKAGQYMAAGAVGGYKLGSSLGNNIADRAKNQKEMIEEAKNEGKKARYGREEYEKREQEKYSNMFNQEFRKAGDSETKANQDVSNLFDAVGKFHSYKK